MNILQAIILGIIQGITEWFPVSSSGHLVILQQFLRIDATVLFDLILHLGSVLALLIFFWRDIMQIIKAVLFWKIKDIHFKLGMFVILASIPTAIIGFLFKDFFESLFSSIFAVGIALLVTGTVLFLTQYIQSTAPLTSVKSFLIGIIQGIAIIPGISRSGSTISAGMLLGVKKEEAARFSFLLGIPAILGATAFEFSSASLHTIELLPSLIGFLASFIIGYASLFLLIRIIQQKKFHYFSWYCWSIGILAIVLALA